MMMQLTIILNSVSRLTVHTFQHCLCFEHMISKLVLGCFLFLTFIVYDAQMPSLINLLNVVLDYYTAFVTVYCLCAIYSTQLGGLFSIGGYWSSIMVKILVTFLFIDKCLTVSE